MFFTALVFWCMCVWWWWWQLCGFGSNVSCFVCSDQAWINTCLMNHKDIPTRLLLWWGLPEACTREVNNVSLGSGRSISLAQMLEQVTFHNRTSQFKLPTASTKWSQTFSFNPWSVELNIHLEWVEYRKAMGYRRTQYHSNRESNKGFMYTTNRVRMCLSNLDFGKELFTIWHSWSAFHCWQRKVYRWHRCAQYQISWWSVVTGERLYLLSRCRIRSERVHPQALIRGPYEGSRGLQRHGAMNIVIWILQLNVQRSSNFLKWHGLVCFLCPSWCYSLTFLLSMLLTDMLLVS